MAIIQPQVKLHFFTGQNNSRVQHFGLNFDARYFDGRMVTDRSTSAINLHIPSQIKPKAGDATPFIEFMEYMFLQEAECLEVMRWCATLIAQPKVRMEYGLLLVSEQ